MPIDIVMGKAFMESESFTPAEWIEHITNTMGNAHHFARENLKCNQKRRKRLYDIRFNEDLFEIGDFVYRLDEKSEIGKSKKLRSPWQGPYVITICKHPIYRIAKQKKELFVHHDKLKTCNDENVPMWLRRKRNELLNIPPINEDSDADPANGSDGEILDLEDDNEGLMDLFVGSNNANTSVTKLNDTDVETSDDQGYAVTRGGRTIRRPFRFQ